MTVRGAGGHGSAPHRAKDPIPAAAEMVTALQTMVTRQFDIFDPVVVTVGLVPRRHPAQHHPGRRRRSRPPCGRFSAEAAPERIEERVGAAVPGHRGRARAGRWRSSYEREYPVTVNDADRGRVRRRTVARGVRRGAATPRCPTRSPAPRTSPGCSSRCPARPVPRRHRARRRPGDRAVQPLAAGGVRRRVLADGAALLAELALGHLLAP